MSEEKDVSAESDMSFGHADALVVVAVVVVGLAFTAGCISRTLDRLLGAVMDGVIW